MEVRLWIGAVLTAFSLRGSGQSSSFSLSRHYTNRGILAITYRAVPNSDRFFFFPKSRSPEGYRRYDDNRRYGYGGFYRGGYRGRYGYV